MMRRLPVLALAAFVALSACGNDKSGGLLGGVPVKALAQAALAQAGIGQGAATPAAAPVAPDAAQIAESRRVLEEAGTPLYIIQNKSLGFLAYFGKWGQNGDVETWSTQDYTAVSLRDGVVVATRGFGADIMSADLPPLSVIRTGTGATRRVYDYNDAADQMLRYAFTCTLSAQSGVALTLIGKTYRTRLVQETCVPADGKAAAGFVNSYWFDEAAKLRQSSQLLAPGIENLLLQRIID